MNKRVFIIVTYLKISIKIAAVWNFIWLAAMFVNWEFYSPIDLVRNLPNYSLEKRGWIVTIFIVQELYKWIFITQQIDKWKSQP